MFVEISCEGPRQVHDVWRERLQDAQTRYSQTRDQEALAAYRSILKTFSDMVLRGKMPEDRSS